jgi:hypothetical protein
MKRTSPFIGACFVFAMIATGSSQTLSEAAQQRMSDHSLMVPVAGTAQAAPQRMAPRSLSSSSVFLKSSSLKSPTFLKSSTSFKSNTGAQTSSAKGNPGGLPGIDSVPNFTRAFRSQGQVWPFTMIGNDPLLGRRTRVPARILAVSLELQNADLVSTTRVPVAQFEERVLRSPNFEESNYSSGDGIQFADAIQRAEFFHSMQEDWHTELHPATVVDHMTLQIPRFTTVTVDGVPTQVRTYFSGTADDGSTFVLLLDEFFNDAFFNAVSDQIGANHFSTDALNIVLLPNTFLFSEAEGPAGSLTTGFHTFLFDDTTNPEPVWISIFASWISPGLFGAGIQDVTALSHEISESINNPFLINSVPAWQFPGFPGTCQDNLEIADPIEALDNETFPIRINQGPGNFVYHPQIMALLPWFEDDPRSNAIHGAFSYPDTTALTGPAIPFGPLSCPTQ